MTLAWLTAKRLKLFSRPAFGAVLLAYVFVVATSLESEQLGEDYLVFPAVGRMAAEGRFEALLDPVEVQRAQATVRGRDTLHDGYHAFVNPPPFALCMVPFGALPYAVGFVVYRVNRHLDAGNRNEVVQITAPNLEVDVELGVAGAAHRSLDVNGGEQVAAEEDVPVGFLADGELDRPRRLRARAERQGRVDHRVPAGVPLKKERDAEGEDGVEDEATVLAAGDDKRCDPHQRGNASENPFAA